MRRRTLRKSSKILALAVAVLAVIVVVLVGLGRLAFTRSDAGKAGDTIPINFNAIATRTVDLKNFRSINFAGSWKVHIEQGDAWQVELTYPQAFEESLKVQLDGDELTLNSGMQAQRNWYWRWWGGDHNMNMQARIVMPKLEALQISGFTDMDLTGFTGDKLSIFLSGAGSIEGQNGQYQNLKLVMSGAGNVDLRRMKFTDAQVMLSGGGLVQVGMDGGVLSGNLSGFGNIDYYGNVKDQRIHVSGFGRVRHKE